MDESRTRIVLEGLPLAVLVLEPDGGVAYANAAARSLLGDLGAGPASGDRPAAGAWQAIARAAALHAGRGGGGRDVEVEIRDAGVPRLLRLDLEPGPAGIVCVVRESPGAGVLSQLRRLVAASGGDAERRARFLADLGRALAASLDWETTLNTVARAVVPALADWAVVRVVEEDGRVRRLRTAWSDPGHAALAERLDRYYAEREDAIVQAHAGVGRVLATGRAEIVAPVDDEWLEQVAHDDVHLALLRELAPASLMHVPLLGAGHTLGAITFVRTAQARPYAAADMALAEEVCDRAAAALENARLFAVSERRRSEAEALSEIGRVLAETLDPRLVWQRIADSVRALLDDAPSSALYCFDAAGAAFTMAVSSEPGLDFEWAPLLPAGTGLVGQMPRERRTLASPDVLGDPAIAYPAHVRLRLEGSAFRAVLAAPLVVQERLIGALAVGAVRGRVFSPREIRLLEAFANQAAVALDNARLFGEAQARRQEAEAARAAAEHANRAKDEFLAVLSHELRTPLTAILGWARMLGGGRLPPAEQRRALEVLERNARLQARLIDELLDVSRIVAGKLVLERREIDLVSLIAEVVETALQDPHARAVVAPPAYDVPAVPVSGDALRLQQVFANLLGNAVKFTHAGGRVGVRVSLEGDWGRVDVADTGEGIAPEDLPYIFDRFHQAGSSRARGQGGLGLGLTIARHLVELHGGRVDVTSAGLGQGAVFSVRLPRLKARAAPPAGGRPAGGREPSIERTLSGVRVLFVDDDPDTRALVGAALAAAGADVLVAAGARAALEVLERGRVDVLISDIAMPGIDGFELIARVRAREDLGGRALPAIALTARAASRDRERAVAAGFQAHVTKPMDPLALVDAVRDVLAHR